MISRSTYEETKLDIQQHTNKYTKALQDAVLDQKLVPYAIRKANPIADNYSKDITSLFFSRLREVAENAVDHYQPYADEATRDLIVSNGLDHLVHASYHGLTLPQRLNQSNIILKANIRRSASVGVKLDTKLQNITRVLNDTYPFGAHKHWDTRLFLAEAVRLEHHIAKDIAARRDIKIVRWVTSDTHTVQDYCDTLATAVDPQVAQYILNNNYDIDPHGVYFLYDIPPVPHPNCQCSIRYIGRRGRGYPKKKQKAKKNLIQRIIARIFNR